VTDQRERVLRAWIGLWNDHALGRLGEVVSPTYVHHASSGRDLDLEGFRGGFAAILDAFPDIEYRTEHVVVQGDLVAAYLTARGVHQGVYFGIPASQREVTFRGMYLCRIDAGRISEDWDVFDLLGPVFALGGSVAPPSG
jgi:predicted ester cyclase